MLVLVTFLFLLAATSPGEETASGSVPHFTATPPTQPATVAPSSLYSTSHHLTHCPSPPVTQPTPYTPSSEALSKKDSYLPPTVSPTPLSGIGGKGIHGIGKKGKPGIGGKTRPPTSGSVPHFTATPPTQPATVAPSSLYSTSHHLTHCPSPPVTQPTPYTPSSEALSKKDSYLPSAVSPTPLSGIGGKGIHGVGTKGKPGIGGKTRPGIEGKEGKLSNPGKGGKPWKWIPRVPRLVCCNMWVTLCCTTVIIAAPPPPM